MSVQRSAARPSCPASRSWCARLHRRLILVFALFGSSAVAQTEAPDYYREPGLYPGRDYVNQHAAEYIDPFTGGLKLSYVDLFIPGDGGLDIRVQRTYSVPQGKPPVLRPSPYGLGWTMHFGRVLKSSNANFCIDSNAQSTLDNPVLELPDGTRKLFLNAAGYYGSGAVHWISPDFWLGRCDASGNLTVFSPQGEAYSMGLAVNEGSGTANLYVRYATRLTDRNGNWLAFTYRSLPLITVLEGISASDGRAVDLVYSGAGSATRLASVSGAGITWYYSFQLAPGTTDVYQLVRVDRPGAGSWQYEYNTALNGLAGAYAMKRLRYPQGNTVDYQYAHAQVYPSDAYQFTTVVSRKITAQGTWSFAYTFGSSYDQTVVTTPRYTQTYRHFGIKAAQAAPGNLWKIGLLLYKNTGGLQTETYEWSKRQVSNETTLRRDISGLTQDLGGFAPLLSRQVVTRGGASHTTTYSDFDAYGNPRTIAETGNASRTRTLTYCTNSAKWIIRTVEDESLAGFGTISRSLDANCNVTNENRYGVTRSYTWSSGNLASVTDPRGYKTTYASYLRGIPRLETQPGSVTVSRTVSSAGDVTSETDGEGNIVRYAWDDLHRLTAITPAKAGSNPVSIGYTTTSRTLTRGAYRETVQYDGFGHPVSITRGDSGGSIAIRTTFGHDALGRKTFESYPGATTGSTYTYDALDRVTAITRLASSGASSVTIGFAYGANSVTETNERGYKTTLGYRAFGNPDERWLMGVSFASLTAANLTFARNAIGQLTSVTQGGLTRSFSYASPGPYLTGESHPETGTTTYARDAAGNMISRKVGASGTTRFGYDGRGRLISIDHPDPTPDVALSYTRDDKLDTVTSGAGGRAVVRAFDYDANRNLLRESLSVDGLSFDIGLGYDANDQLASVRYPRTDTLVSYAPDALGRPTRLTLTASGSSETLLTNAAFFPSGRLQSYTRGNGVTATMTQNARLWPSALVHAKAGVSLSSFAYAYDGGGNLTTLTDGLDGTYSATLGYDPLDRLTAVTSGGFTGAITYSPTGNILTQKLSATRQLTYGYDTSHRLTGVSGSLTRSYAYDAYGNVAADGRGTYVHDDAANLIRASVASPQAADLTYTYDGRNTRVKAQRDGAPPTYSIYTAAGELLAEYHQPTQVHSEYFYIAGQQVGRRDTVPADPGLTLATNLTAVPLGTPVTLTARVGTTAATGNVKFYDGEQLLGTRSLAGGSAAIEVPVASGAHSLRAVYDGDPYTAPAQVSLGIDVPQLAGPWLPAVLDLLLGDDEAPVSGTAATAAAAAASTIPEPPPAGPTLPPRSLAATGVPSYEFAPLTHVDADVFGNPVLATDHTGALLWRERYFPYGEKRVADGSRTHPLSFHGKALDADTGLQYFGARSYDPQIGRFTGVDPVSFDEGNVHSFNRYAYGNNNPFRYRDPNGEAPSPIDAFFTAMSGGEFLAASGLWAYGKLTGDPGLTEVAGAAISGTTLALAQDVGGLVNPMPGANGVRRAASTTHRYVTREDRWVQLATEPNSRLAKEVIDHVKRHDGKGVRDRFGLELAHPPGRAASQGHDYSEAVPKLSVDHRGIQHRYLKERKTGSTISVPQKERSGGKLDRPQPGALP